MIWTFKEPAFGDIIRVKIGSIYHMGIFVSESEVIQFGLPPTRRNFFDKDICVLSTSIDTFLDGGFLEVGEPDKKEAKSIRKKEEIVNFARLKLGEKGYHILYNNCEHFVNECAFGKKFSTQTNLVREAFRSIPILDVYVAKIPDGQVFEDVYPLSRAEEIKKVNNLAVKKQKYYVWKLLEYALNRSLGLKIDNLHFEKTDSGKWQTDNLFFSLSHSDNAVCVAISKKAVGVDVEIVCKRNLKLSEKILNSAEIKAYNAINGDKNKFLIEKWTQKESLFKQGNEKSFNPKKTDTIKNSTLTKHVFIDGREYVLSVANENLDKIRFYENVNLQ